MTSAASPVLQDLEEVQRDTDRKVLRIVRWMILATFCLVVVIVGWRIILGALIAFVVLYSATFVIAAVRRRVRVRWEASAQRRRETEAQRLAEEGARERRQRDARVQRLKSYTAAEQMMQLLPTEFESLVLDYFAVQGYEVESTPASGDEGIDGILKLNGEKELLQCKRYLDGVGQPPIRDFSA